LLLGVHLGLDATAQIFLLFTALLWTCAGLFASAYVQRNHTRHLFFAFFLLTMSGNLGLILAQDMVSFYMFFALMTFAAYGLIIHERNEESYRAGRVYLSLAVIGEVFLVSALMLIAATTEDLRFPIANAGYANTPSQSVIIGLLLIGFGIKVGAVPLHVWLPLAHPVAPTPASAVLSGAIIKAGLLGWIRFLPLGQAASPGWSQVCIIVGICSAFYGVLIGLSQRQVKTILAYSSISQMGFLTIGIGLGLGAPEGWPVLLPMVCLYALHHGLAKGALFLGVGVAHMLPTTVWTQRLVFAGLLLPALALAGAPLTSGAVVKGLLKEGLYFAPAPWSTWLKFLLPITAVSTTLLLGRFLFLMRSSEQHHAQHPSVGYVILPWAISLVAVVCTIWMSIPEAFTEAVGQTVTMATVWPVMLGIILVGLVWQGRFVSLRLFPWHIPPGDILVAVTTLGQSVWLQWEALTMLLKARGKSWFTGFMSRLPPIGNRRQ
jgi:formate hydrogenlyase subunit 3/multisubunit Na+/H+ antiporter MnhD subunit